MAKSADQAFNPACRPGLTGVHSYTASISPPSSSPQQGKHVPVHPFPLARPPAASVVPHPPAARAAASASTSCLRLPASPQRSAPLRPAPRCHKGRAARWGAGSRPRAAGHPTWACRNRTPAWRARGASSIRCGLCCQCKHHLVLPLQAPLSVQGWAGASYACSMGKGAWVEITHNHGPEICLIM